MTTDAKIKKQNVLFLVSDDQRWNTIHALGNEAIKTPNLDALVRDGCAFTNAHIPGGTSGAVCMPSRAMIHSGRTLFHLDRLGQTIPNEHTTLGEALRGAGYRSCGVGKWHNGVDGYQRSFECGGNIFFGGMWDHWNVPVCDYREAGDYPENVFTKDFYSGNETMKLLADRVAMGTHSSELMADTAIDFLETCDDEQPFFLYTAFLAPHDPRTMPEEFRQMYKPDDIELPPSFMEQHFVDYGITDMRDEVLAPFPRTAKDTKRHIAEYYAMITHLDYHIGRIINKLREKGLYEDTTIVFCGDNGLGLAEHGYMGKQNLYEHSIRVPLIIKSTALPQGKQVDSFAYLMDIYPTLCELLGIKTPASVEGKSLVPAVIDEKEIHDSLYIAFTNKVRGVKTKRHKLIEYRTKELNKTQLFDLEADPYEMNDLSQKEECSDIVRYLRALMFEYKDKWDDPSHVMGQEYWANYGSTKNARVDRNT